jgi:hypothetical protein
VGWPGIRAIPAASITNIPKTMIALMIPHMFAAAGYSLIYMLGGGGLFGAIVIFFVAKMFGK